MSREIIVVIRWLFVSFPQLTLTMAQSFSGDEMTSLSPLLSSSSPHNLSTLTLLSLPPPPPISSSSHWTFGLFKVQSNKIENSKWQMYRLFTFKCILRKKCIYEFHRHHLLLTQTGKGKNEDEKESIKSWPLNKEGRTNQSSSSF